MSQRPLPHIAYHVQEPALDDLQYSGGRPVDHADCLTHTKTKPRYVYIGRLLHLQGPGRLQEGLPAGAGTWTKTHPHKYTHSLIHHPSTTITHEQGPVLALNGGDNFARTLSLSGDGRVASLGSTSWATNRGAVWTYVN